MAWWNVLKFITSKPPVNEGLEAAVKEAWDAYNDTHTCIKYEGWFSNPAEGREAVEEFMRKHMRSSTAHPVNARTRDNRALLVYQVSPIEMLSIAHGDCRDGYLFAYRAEFELMNDSYPPKEREALVRAIVTLVARSDTGTGYHGKYFDDTSCYHGYAQAQFRKSGDA
jgi:hypothetical protein